MKSEVLRDIDKPEIVSIIEREIPLKKSGKYYVGLCPFHPDRSPSFTINPDRQTFRCYGCGAHGDVIEFVRQLHDLSFRDALQELGIEPVKRERKPSLAHLKDTLKRVVLEIEYRTFLQRFSVLLASFLRVFNRLLLSKGIEIDPCELDEEELIQVLPDILKNAGSIEEAETLVQWISDARQWYREVEIIHSRDEQARFQLFQGVMHGNL